MKIIENLAAERLSKDELKKINGGGAPHCLGTACIVGFDDNDNVVWECFPAGYKCPGI